MFSFINSFALYFTFYSFHFSFALYIPTSSNLLSKRESTHFVPVSYTHLRRRRRRNETKAKYTKLQRNVTTNQVDILVGKYTFERVQQCSYLGSQIVQNNSYSNEIKSRIARSKADVINPMKSFSNPGC